MTTTEFRELVSQVTTQLEGRPLNSNLELYLLPQGAIEFSQT